MEIEKVMDRKKLASTIEGFLDAGLSLLRKDHLEQNDHAKIKVLRTMGSHVNAAIAMVFFMTSFPTVLSLGQSTRTECLQQG